MSRTRRRPQRAFYSVPEVATILGIHRVTAYRMAKQQGQIAGVPAVQATPTRFVFSRAAIDRLASGQSETEAAV